MKYKYGIKDIFLAGRPNRFVIHEGATVYYSDDVEDLLEVANSGKDVQRGVLVEMKNGQFLIKVKNKDESESFITSPAIIYPRGDYFEEYEPYSDMDSFIRDYLDHVPSNDFTLSQLNGEYLFRASENGYDLMAILAIKDTGLSFLDDINVSWKNVMDNYYFLDKTVCGRKVWKKSDL